MSEGLQHYLWTKNCSFGQTQIRNSFKTQNLIEMPVDDEKFLQYHSRNLPLQILGKEALEDFRYERVTIAGVGGLGTVIAEQLAACGVGKLRLIDQDFVELHNLPRQKLFFEKDIGRPKVEAAREFIEKRNPFVEIEAIHTRLDESNAFQLLEGSSVVIDALDNFETRKIINIECYKLGIPWIFGGALVETGNVMSITYKENTPCFHCLFEESTDEGAPTCATAGVYPPILGLIANIQVEEAIRILRHMKPLLESKLMVISTADLSFEKIAVKKRENCPVCGKTPRIRRARGDSVREEIHHPVLGDITITGICGSGNFIAHPQQEPKWDFEAVAQKLLNRWEGKRIGKSVVRLLLGDGRRVQVAKSGVMTIVVNETVEEAIEICQEVLSVAVQSIEQERQT